MIIVTCVPPAGYESYRCGWREEERDGKKVRVGFCWPAGATELEDDALTEEQIEMLKRDPGKRITVRVLPGIKASTKASEDAKAKAGSGKQAKDTARDDEEPESEEA
ncbi:hypothetical protein [Polyangium aurulentum]|uniref:hypothetical protein n=1 Tax=Polyangium aurulentum TaxID=2567896 RepID=UPI0010ADCD7C|nr:hypothetical protein [Polyangium aurulentum]UQA57074.1 hypothetical protein E8A73_038155 [Polyangium aurulentum]